jgi:hypothetical protein
MMVRSYLNFLLRPLPTHSVITGAETINNFSVEISFWTVFFTIAFFLIELIGRKVFSSWYNNLTPRKKNEFSAYLVVLIHHLVLVPRAWKMIYDDALRDENDLTIVSYPVEGGKLAPFCLGYLLSDTLCYALPQLFSVGDSAYLIHHISVSWLVTASMFSNGHLLRFIPHLLICDTTNIFFNIAWILRTMKNETIRNSFFVIFLELLFAFFFLFVRVINLPIAFYAIVKSNYGYELGIVRWTFVPIVLLQWFWFLKVINGMNSRLKETNKNKTPKCVVKGTKEDNVIASEDAIEKVVKEKKII